MRRVFTKHDWSFDRAYFHWNEAADQWDLYYLTSNDVLVKVGDNDGGRTGSNWKETT